MKQMRPVGLWMVGLAGLVFLMVVIGAVTRLTNSGLSIVDWKLIDDIVPPHDPAAWNHAFALYHTSPQYRLVHRGMTLDQYKHIFFWEWLHRLWGRAVLGGALVVPLAVFAWRGYINRRVMGMLVPVFLLAALQAFAAWYMVESGLDRQPSVSHYRLAAHLTIALLIYSTLMWNGWSLLYPMSLMRGSAAGVQSLRRHAAAGLALVAATMTWGAFVAGLKAGLIYNTFPLMGGRLLPSEWLYFQPAWINFLMNQATVQFTHRCLAIATGGALLALVYRSWKVEMVPAAKSIANYIGLAVPAQIALGVSTLLHHVPIWMGALHQAGAITVLTLVLAFLFVLRRPRAGAILERVQEAPLRPRSGMAPSTQHTQNQGWTEPDR